LIFALRSVKAVYHHIRTN